MSVEFAFEVDFERDIDDEAMVGWRSIAIRKQSMADIFVFEITLGRCFDELWFFLVLISLTLSRLEISVESNDKRRETFNAASLVYPNWIKPWYVVSCPLRRCTNESNGL